MTCHIMRSYLLKVVNFKLITWKLLLTVKNSLNQVYMPQAKLTRYAAYSFDEFYMSVITSMEPERIT